MSSRSTSSMSSGSEDEVYETRFFDEQKPSFLAQLNEKEISKPTNKLKNAKRKFVKPQSESEESRSGEDSEDSLASDVASDDAASDIPSDADDNLEDNYQLQLQKQHSKASPQAEQNRLPIKLDDGKIKNLPSRPKQLKADDIYESQSEQEEDDQEVDKDKSDEADEEDSDEKTHHIYRIYMQNNTKKSQLAAAKFTMASIAQTVLTDPEENLIHIRKLQQLTQYKLKYDDKEIVNLESIRQLSHLSLSAIFVDILPSYRIRKLSEKEKTEKVSKEVAARRQWEELIIQLYQNWLASLDKEIKKASTLTKVCLQCMCIMLERATHFNFHTNIMECVIGRISKQSWDELSKMCYDALEKVLKSDVSGEFSLEITKILNRMIKERQFRISPNVLSLFNNLRLREELTLESTQKPNKHQRKFKENKEKKHLSKKAKKAHRENKEIEKEMKEAQVEVDKETKDRNNTETLKLIFVIYFRILKFPESSPLLPVALEGVANFSHLVNVDFFVDLLDVLKSISKRAELDALVEEKLVHEEDENVDTLVPSSETRLRLLCISTAFKLLTDQGESLNIDLDDFLTSLYALLLPLSISPTIETVPDNSVKSFKKIKPVHAKSESELLFDTLNIVFFTARNQTKGVPSTRCLAFAKRILICTLQWPGDSSLKAVDFVQKLVGIAGGSVIETLLSTEDRMSGEGGYKAYLNDPYACNAQNALGFELALLESQHYDSRVRNAAYELANTKR
ncbi:hypothetical protein E3P92_00062 [Wallemia ichthyophaga]|uniref:Nucleolar complex-associated protein 3 n=2 Tax=Wallemia ichthyophaga TaxID=245174 RepID=A0A4T0HQM5_WALIC|nr:Nucleolar complex protein 3-like protein [Wallemia ichthyophaga EXF-994]TIB04834.1 hypothetical protein E3P95_00062 [Wallemia ichthyophaga]EOR04119.1 Nucleolar complex protein 3-like protein [Wallemia ichthyophaga EXF-994]TIB05995.1 hypothetical protein E3P94_00062 [Wallemia ichthyophaga]TIB17386.1 hypothetical protein E3P90_00063 [Wallemia ichthyophaga]TIB18558.1 hypothetical protein E3P93_00063 [Wallemia ichthyophaga]